MKGKAVLISIKPKWCTAIFCGDKDVEVRKTKPQKLQPPFKCYVYCTKGSGKSGLAEGMVIGEFVCDRIYQLDMDSVGIGAHCKDGFVYLSDVGWNTALTRKEFLAYAGTKRPFGWHVSQPRLYKEPLTIGDVKPPQSWCYVYESEVKNDESKIVPN